MVGRHSTRQRVIAAVLIGIFIVGSALGICLALRRPGGKSGFHLPGYQPCCVPDTGVDVARWPRLASMSRETRFATRPRRALGTEEATDMAEASLDRRHSVSRVPAVLVGLGGLVFIAGIAFPVVGEVFSHLDDPAAMQAAIEADPVSWDVAAGLTGVGALITALGLFLLGRGLAAVTQRPRPRAAAAAGGWLGLGVAAWVAVALYRVLASPSVIAENQNLYSGWDLAVGAIWFLGVLGSFVAFGLALVWLRHLRILGWLLIVGGTLLAVVGVILPVIPFFGYAGAGIALAIAPPRDHAAD